MSPPATGRQLGAGAADRSSYALAQARLLDFLLRGGDLPSGLDAVKAAAAADALQRKRARSISRTCPALADALGVRFEPLVREYILRTPRPAAGHGLRDGLQFARELAAEVQLTDAARAESLQLRARTRRLFLGATRIRRSWLFVVVRLPLARTRLVVLALPGARRRSPPRPALPHRPSSHARNDPPSPVCGPATAPQRSSSAIGSPS